MFWDKIAGVYDIFTNTLNGKVHHILCKEIEEMIVSSDKILECACGTGMLSVYIAPRCKNLIATDISKNMLKEAKKKCKHYNNVKFQIVDIFHLPYKDNSFDKVIAGNVIHLLDNPYQALKELERVCCKGGKIIIPTYAMEEKRGIYYIAKGIGKIGVHFKRQFNYKKYQKFFKEAGYKNVEYSFIQGRLPCVIAVITK